jgi:hypothetical protein
MKKNKFIKKKIKGIVVDVRSKDCLYIKIKDWVIYIDNSTNEKIINSWNINENTRSIKTSWRFK